VKISPNPIVISHKDNMRAQALSWDARPTDGAVSGVLRASPEASISSQTLYITPSSKNHVHIYQPSLKSFGRVDPYTMSRSLPSLPIPTIPYAPIPLPDRSTPTWNSLMPRVQTVDEAKTFHSYDYPIPRELSSHEYKTSSFPHNIADFSTNSVVSAVAPDTNSSIQSSLIIRAGKDTFLPDYITASSPAALTYHYPLKR
jgi:hypothetical protein